MFISTLSGMPLARRGAVRPIAMTGLKRLASIPDVPTISESGVPGYEANNWWGFVAPTGTPAEIIARLDKEIAAIAASPDTKKRLQAEGAEPVHRGPGEFGKFIKTEMNKWSKVVKEAGIKGE